MALNKRFLDPTGSGSKGTKTVGIYETTDNKATVKGAGYFNAAASELARVAILWIVASDATFPAKVAVSAGVVTISLVDVYT
jgi:hypothetical protein